MAEQCPVHRLEAIGLRLFQDFPALRGVVSAVIDGGMGIARADDAQEPQVASLTLHFDLVAGDPHSEHAKPLLHGLRGAIACDAQWENLFHREFGVEPAYSPRVAFEPGEWDRERLRAERGIKLGTGEQPAGGTR
jgi:hypothetical protein